MTRVVRKETLEDIIKELRRRIRVLETSARTATAIATTVGYASVQDEGVSLPSRTSIDFVGDAVTATDDPDNDRTIVTVAAGGTTTADSWLYEEVIAYSGITSYTLTMLPIEGAVFAYLNGLAMREVVDYSVDYSTGIVSFNVPLTYSPPPSDIVTFRYESTGSPSPAPAPLPPTLISVAPTTVMAGDNVTLSIANVAPVQGSWVVRIATSSAVLDCAVVSWSSTTVVATIPVDPNLAPGQTYDCTIFIRDDISRLVTNSLPLTVNVASLFRSATPAGIGAPALPTDTQAGDFGILFVAHEVARTWSSLNGWTVQGSQTFTHAGAFGTFDYQLDVLTKASVAGVSDVPVIGSGVNQVCYVAAVVAGGATYNETQMASVTNSTSAATPVVTTGNLTVRGWACESVGGNFVTIPATEIGDTGGTDIDIAASADLTKSSLTAVISAEASWATAAVAVTV